MQRYVARRLVQNLFVLLGVSTVVFFLLSLSGDPAALMLPAGATQEDLDRLRESMGLNRPLPERYVLFMKDAFRGDFGDSLAVGTPALDMVLSRMPATIGLATAALLFALVLAFPAGIIAGLRRGSWVDTACMGVALVGQSVPVFWLGLMLILLFSVNLKWLPTGGTGGLDHLILPMITLGLFSMARTARLVRSGMIEVMQNDFIRTARAKGLTEQAIVQRHALRFALIPLVTVIGLDLATLLGGAVITETIFSWPGVGRLVVDSIRSRDYPV
ncbi:MAG: peptide/nickel transport system permease protein, partial [Thermomicrobiales bacterium]|nr:peptide/nickel transport system permease protein [Thermomicrobiales bacterium]